MPFLEASFENAIEPKCFVETLTKAGINFYSGVPCSVFNAVLPLIERHKALNYVAAPREDMAVSLCAGAYFAGKYPAIIMQNTGLGNCTEVLMGLNLLYAIPVLLIMSWRGYQRTDEAQHWLWGEKQNDILKSINIPYFVFDPKNPAQSVHEACRLLNKSSKPVALIVKRGSIYEAR